MERATAGAGATPGASSSTSTSPPPTTSLPDWERFRTEGVQMVNWIADYYGSLARGDFPVKSQVVPGYLAPILPSTAPEKPEPFDAILRDVDAHIVPGVTHWQSPSFMGYFPANTSPPALLGDMLSGAFGVIAFSWVASPAATELESVVLEWLRKAMALPEAFSPSGTGGGLIQGTASEATLVALLAARAKAFATCRGGQLAASSAAAAAATAAPSPSSPPTSSEFDFQASLVCYASDQAHSSVKKAMSIAGLRPSQCRILPTAGPGHALDPELLRAAMEADRAAGRTPFFVCATLGTTSSGAFDPLGPIAAVCKASITSCVWLHVDAAWAGSALLCPEHRPLADGVERCDSFAFNPHKHLRTTFDCCCMFVAVRHWLLLALSTTPEYLRSPEHDAGLVSDFRDWQIPLGRRFRSLKLWFVLRMHGLERLRAAFREHCRLAGVFAGLVASDPRFEVPVPVSLSLVCFRLRRRDGEDVEAANARNEALLARIQASGELYLVHTKLEGVSTLRFAIGSTLTEESHVRKGWEVIVRECGRETEAV